MSIVRGRGAVLDLYAEAGERRRVLPCFCSENLTTTEAVLEAATLRARELGEEAPPLILALTCNYGPRPQARFYTATRDWRTGLRLFLADLEVLAGPGGPYEELRVMVHLDHAQFDDDAELLKGDLAPFSSVMFDASRLPFEENLALTRTFADARRSELLIEGACDEIAEAAGSERGGLTDGPQARDFLERSGADLVVANLGTEHRASAGELRYRGDMARRIKELIGPRIVLHGVSSVPGEQIEGLFDDGVCKANIWTALERDASPALLRGMASNASKVAGAPEAGRLAAEGILGAAADIASKASLDYFTTSYRQGVVHRGMVGIALSYFRMWYR